MKNKFYKRALAFALALALVAGVSPVNVGRGEIADRAEIVANAENTYEETISTTGYGNGYNGETYNGALFTIRCEKYNGQHGSNFSDYPLTITAKKDDIITKIVLTLDPLDTKTATANGTITATAVSSDGIETITFSDINSTSVAITSSGTMRATSAQIFYKKAVYTISFDTNVNFETNNSTTPEAQKIESGSTATKPTIDSYDDNSGMGWNVKEWYDNADCTGNAFDFENTAITGNKTLYAKWEKADLKVTCDNEVAKAFTLNKRRANAEDSIELTLKAGYTFDGNLTANGSDVNKDGNTYSFTMPNSDVNVSITDGSSIQKTPYDITKGTNISKITVLKGEGSDPITTTDTTSTIPAQVGDTVQFTLDYPVKKDGETGDPILDEEGNPILDETKVLKKITVSGTDGQEIEFNKVAYDTYEMTMPAGGITISAEFAQLYEYTVFYFSNNEEDKATAGRILCENLSHDGILEQNVILNSKAVYSMLANMPDAENLQFKYKDSDGWSASRTVPVTVNPNKDSLENLATSLANGDKVLIIKGNTNVSGISFAAETNEKVNNTFINDTKDYFTLENTSVPAPAAPVREGYTFLGWEDRITGTVYNPEQNIQAPAANEVLLLNAKWKHSSITATFQDTGTTQSVEYQGKVTKPADPTKEGYAFVRWVVAQTSESGTFRKGEVFDFDKEITENVTLKAEWKHVHNYGYYALNAPVFHGAFDKYCNLKNEDGTDNDKYLLPSLHVKVCGSWDDYKIEAHHFDETGKCADCGYQKEVKYVTVVNLSENSLEEKQYVKGSSITVTAPEKKDNKVFDFWCYAVDGNTNYSMFSKSRSVTFTVPENDPMEKVTVYPVYKVQQQPVENINQANIQWHVSKVKNNTELQFVMCYDLPKGWVARDFCLRYGNNDDIRYFRKSSLSGMDVMGQNFKSMVGKKNNGYYMFDTPKTADLMFGSVPIYYPVNDNVITKEFNGNAWKLWDKMYSGKGITVSDMSLGAFGCSIAGRTSGTPYVTLKPTSSNQIFYMMGYLNCVNTTTKEVKMIKVAPVAFSLDGNPNGYQETTTAISSN